MKNYYFFQVVFSCRIHHFSKNTALTFLLRDFSETGPSRYAANAPTEGPASSLPWRLSLNAWTAEGR